MRHRRSVLAAVTTAAVLAAAVPGLAAPNPPQPSARRQLAALARHVHHQRATTGYAKADNGGDSEDPIAGSLQFARVRTAPAGQVSGAALSAAARAGDRLPVRGGTWSELTSGTTNSETPGYADPSWSDYGSGWGLVTGRATALATDGGWVYAGFADGGVWASHDGGKHWTPTFQHEVTESIGALWVNPADHSLWVGTGEANTSADEFTGQGVYRSSDHGRTYVRVGGDELQNAQVFTLTEEGGNLFAATSHGLWRRSLTAGGATAWESVLKPDPNPGNSPYRTSMISSVVVKPGTRTVVAALGWRLGTPYDGLYVSTQGGAAGSFQRLQPAGLDNSDIGRTSLAYAPDGSALYAVIQSPNNALNGPPAPAKSTTLKGVYESANGDPNGPWTLVADAAKLASSGSAMSFPSGYEPGVGSWYNQYVKVDPKDPKHVYLGLEEIYETRDGGSSWNAVSPFWNFTPNCYVAPGPDKCPPTTHTDQHAIAISKDGTLYTGSDGGIWSRPTSLSTVAGWQDLNVGLHTLQYFYVGAGKDPHGGTALWGGLQDNGGTLLPGDSRNVIQPFAGDGGDVIVDPANADRAALEYVDADITVTTVGGRSDGVTPAFREISPACLYNSALPGCDPNPQFIAPFKRDVADLDHWITGGRYVWESKKGFDTVCQGATCDWKPVYDTGPHGSVTTVESNAGVDYAGWCGPCNPSDASGGGFQSGLATDYGGTWHAVTAPNLPNRYVTRIVSDPANPAHVYAVYGGYSRRWIPGAGVGHVFESTDGGTTWTDISGNLPDVPADALVIAKGKLVLATDHLVYVADMKAPAHWSRLGHDLPSAVDTDLTLYPSGDTVVVATHGRGLWKLDL